MALYKYDNFCEKRFNTLAVFFEESACVNELRASLNRFPR